MTISLPATPTYIQKRQSSNTNIHHSSQAYFILKSKKKLTKKLDYLNAILFSDLVIAHKTMVIYQDMSNFWRPKV